MLLTMKDKNRVEVIAGVMDGRISVSDAGRVLNRSVRQVYRMLKRMKVAGLDGMIHQNRGRTGPRKITTGIRQKIVKWAQGKYTGINDMHFTEILKREEGITISRPTVRNILREAGILAKLQRRSPKYRACRERKEAMGMMLQIDGSPHDWLEGRGPWLTIVGAVDDATGTVWAQFHPTETTWAYFHLMGEVFRSHGLPLSLYSDRHGIFYVNREPTIIEQLQGRRPLTQFGRAMEALGVALIKAYSPQAKGRIENRWKTFQDRLVVELRLAGAKTREEANKILKFFLKDFNSRFPVEPRKDQALFRPAPTSKALDRILCLKETRTVNKDHTISFEGVIFQIPRSSQWVSIAGQKVEVLQLKNGNVEIVYKQQIVARFQAEAISALITKIKDPKTEMKKMA